MPCNDDHDRDDDNDHHHHHCDHHRDHHGIDGRQVQVMEGGRRWKLEALHGFPGLLATLPTGLVFLVMIDMMNMVMGMVVYVCDLTHLLLFHVMYYKLQNNNILLLKQLQKYYGLLDMFHVRHVGQIVTICTNTG